MASKQLHFVSLIDSELDCYHVRCKTFETSILHVNNNSFTGPLIFQKRTPGPISDHNFTKP